MRIKVLALLCVFSMGITGHHATGQTTLPDLINYTLEHSREVKKSELQCQEAGYLRKETVGRGLPQIDASATYSRMGYNVDIPQSMYDMVNEYAPTEYQQMVTGILRQIDDINAIHIANAGFQITQLIYSQSYWVGVKTAKKTQELYSILKTKTDEDVIAEVSTGYYQTGSLMLQLQTIDKSIENLKQIYRIAELGYQNDFVKETNVNRLKVTISNLEVTRQTVQNGVNIQLNYLKALAGIPADSTLTIDPAALVNDFVNTEPAINFDVAHVPSFQALLKQEEIYDQQVKLAKAKYYPTLAAFGKFNLSSYSTSLEFNKLSNMNTLGFSLSMPVFSSGANASKVKQAQLKEAQLKEDILKANDLLTVNYNNASMEYETARALLEAQKANRELALKVYHQTSSQYKEGMASMADLLNVNSDFLQADNSLNQQILKCKTAEINMLKASGNLKIMINRK